MEQFDKIKKIMEELPAYCRGYFEEKSTVLSNDSLYMYGVDLRGFFYYLKEEKVKKEDVTLEDLKCISYCDIEDYVSYLTHYCRHGKVMNNTAGSKQRKVVVIRSFFSYMVYHNFIEKNPTNGIPVPRKNIKKIKDRNQDDVVKILEFALDPKSYMGSRKKNEIHQRNRIRNYLILLLLLQYEISPAVISRLNVSDIKEGSIQFENKGVTRNIVLAPAHRAEFERYISGPQNVRSGYGTPNRIEDQDSLFYSRKKNRISIRNIEVLSADYQKSGIIQRNRESEC